MKYRASLSPFVLTGCLADSASPELCLNSVWYESMKYRASLSQVQVARKVLSRRCEFCQYGVALALKCVGVCDL